MATPQKARKAVAEYAKSSRTSCKTCKEAIDKEIEMLRLGKMVQATQFDGFMPLWNHADYILRKSKQIISVDDVGGLELLRWEDQEKIRNYVEGGGSSNATAKAPTVSAIGIETVPASRSSCKQCGQKIMKGTVRISTKPDGQRSKALVWLHANCYLEVSQITQVEKLLGWDTLAPSGQAAVLASVKRGSSTAKDKETLEESKATGKRKRADSGKTNFLKLM